MFGKAEIIKMTEGLYQEVLDASSYFVVLQYYRQIVDTDFMKEYRMAVGFHALVQQSLCSAMFMDIAKLYDKQGDSKSITIGSILNDCSENMSVFQNGTHYEYLVHSQNYKCLLGKYVDKLPSLRTESCSGAEFGTCRITLSPAEAIDVFGLQLSSYSKIIGKVTDFRNLVYAHNDKSLNFNIADLTVRSGISWLEIAKLLDLAYDVCSFVYCMLDNTDILRCYLHIDDITDLFYLLRRGRKFSSITQCLAMLHDAGRDDLAKEKVSVSELIDVSRFGNEQPMKIEFPLGSDVSYTDFLMSHSTLQ